MKKTKTIPILPELTRDDIINQTNQLGKEVEEEKISDDHVGFGKIINEINSMSTEEIEFTLIKLLNEIQKPGTIGFTTKMTNEERKEWFADREKYIKSRKYHDNSDDSISGDIKTMAEKLGITDQVNHPPHYGGEDNPYEAIKIIEAMGWGYEFCMGNVIKYKLRAGKKEGQSKEQDEKKADWYLNRANEIKLKQK